MKRILKTVFPLAVFLLVLSSNSSFSKPGTEPDTVTIQEPKLMGSKWIVKSVETSPNGLVTWKTGNTVAHIQLPDSLFETLKGELKYILKLEANSEVTLRVREGAKADTYYYAIFVMKAEEYAISISPPKIIIR